MADEVIELSFLEADHTGFALVGKEESDRRILWWKRAGESLRPHKSSG
jgi:hypothetical protein